MLDVCLLGTGGMMPLPYRWLTALMLRHNGSSLLIDCGEGTQISIKEKGWSFKPIDVICITHFHGDHISGLPGLLLTIGNAERKEPITIIGPKGLERIVNGLRVIAPDLPFKLKFIELDQKKQIFNLNGYEIEAFRVKHNITCYGYNVKINRKGKFNVENALKYNIPKTCWGRLQKGEVINDGENLYTPDMVLGKERKGIKLTYTTDTRPVDHIVEANKGADLFICEGMYGEEDKQDKAKEYKHMTFQEAAYLAKKGNVKELWLTHYSPSLVKPEEYMHTVKSIFRNSKAGKDHKTKILTFED